MKPSWFEYHCSFLLYNKDQRVNGLSIDLSFYLVIPTYSLKKQASCYFIENCLVVVLYHIWHIYMFKVAHLNLNQVEKTKFNLNRPSFRWYNSHVYSLNSMIFTDRWLMDFLIIKIKILAAILDFIPFLLLRLIILYLQYIKIPYG